MRGMDACAQFRGKNITLMGLGLLGRGVGDARYLAECGANLVVTDLKSAQELTPSLAELKQFSNIRYTLGRHELEDFRRRDVVLYGPKTAPDSAYLKEARDAGIRTTMSTALFATLCGVPVVGITGTRGKTTTTEMIAHILRRAGKKVLLGGNIRGVSTLALLPDVTADTIPILELDSWQLQGFRDESIGPHVTVFTTFYPDHMDYYRGDMDAYLADKAEIFLHQKSGDVLILGSQAAPFVKQKYPAQTAGAVVADARDLAGWKLKIPGNHNLENAACAVAATRALGVDEKTIRSALENFEGVPGRLELVREIGGVKIYNDTTATTPEATLAALEALAPRKDSGQNQNLILILGGADKRLDMTRLLAEIPKRTKRIILLAGTGTDRVKDKLPGATIYDSIVSAVSAALAAASSGDTILFSPAFASFGMFKNEYDRGDQFDAVVKML